jgi:serine/threonine protein kinase
MKLFEREIAVHSTVDHPHIVKLWDTIMEDDQLYMIMEYAENGNLFYHQNTKTTFTEP